MTRHHHDIPVHPDDLLFFNEVVTSMRRVAKQYALPLKSVSGYPMPRKGLADRLGDCNASGDIRLVMRATDNGDWCDAPLSPAEIWNTAAHELAHLRHMRHGEQHTAFTIELLARLREIQLTDHEKVMDKLVKLQAQAEGEHRIGNVAAAEAFASKVSAMLLDHELTQTDLEYAKTRDKDPIVEMKCDLAKYNIKGKKSRIAWQESLARIVARAHLCSFLLRPSSNDIWFVGTKTHATLAEYAYGILVPVVEQWSIKEFWTYTWEVRQRGERYKAKGFRAAWLSAFLKRINERFEEVRKQAVEADRTRTGTDSQALMRLDGCLVRVNTYINDKFKNRRGRGASALNGVYGSHAIGREWGTAAANRVVIGRRGVNGPTDRKRLNEGGV